MLERETPLVVLAYRWSRSLPYLPLKNLSNGRLAILYSPLLWVNINLRECEVVVTPSLLVAVEDGIATITINRPEKRNALSREVRDGLKNEVAQFNDDPRVRVIILTGSDPAFSAGVDFREMEDPSTDISSIGPLDAPFLISTTPLIGAINGPAYTGGLELALACHFLIASEKASFADTHAKMGLMPGWGLSILLAEAIGSRRARQMSTTCQPIDAHTACTWGLVNLVVAHDQLTASSQKIAREIAANDYDAIKRAGQLSNAQAEVHNQALWDLESSHWSGIHKTETSEKIAGKWVTDSNDC